MVFKNPIISYHSFFLLKNSFILFLGMVCGNFNVRRANITQKKRRHWSAREKLMVVAYHE